MMSTDNDMNSKENAFKNAICKMVAIYLGLNVENIMICSKTVILICSPGVIYSNIG